jgi:hypothetical protein
MNVHTDNADKLNALKPLCFDILGSQIEANVGRSKCWKPLHA